jgi:hypothetical protein
VKDPVTVTERPESLDDDMDARLLDGISFAEEPMYAGPAIWGRAASSQASTSPTTRVERVVGHVENVPTAPTHR